MEGLKEHSVYVYSICIHTRARAHTYARAHTHYTLIFRQNKLTVIARRRTLVLLSTSAFGIPRKLFLLRS